jgi:hypothetical protein
VVAGKVDVHGIEIACVNFEGGLHCEETICDECRCQIIDVVVVAPAGEHMRHVVGL